VGSRAPGTKSRKGRRRYLKRLNAHRETFIPQAWQALMQAEADFADAQAALAAVPGKIMILVVTAFAFHLIRDGDKNR
jgi:hypothetical protein